MEKTNNLVEIPTSPALQFLFADKRMGWVWLVVRIYVGWQWIVAGWEKLYSPVWTGDQAGVALHGFISGALKKTVGLHPDVQGWYAAFLQTYVDQHLAGFSYLVTFGEIIIGVALVLGLFTGLAAFFGSFMNLNFLMAGTVSINPILLVLQLLLIFGWRVAGWIGLDRYVLVALGTPWEKGSLVTDKTDILQNITEFSLKKAFGYGALLWLIGTGIIGAVHGFGIHFGVGSYIFIRIIAALVFGGIALIFSKEVEVSDAKQALGYSLLWLVAPLLLDLLIVSPFAAGLFSFWQYWLGHVLVLLAPWAVLAFNRKGQNV